MRRRSRSRVAIGTMHFPARRLAPAAVPLMRRRQWPAAVQSAPSEDEAHIEMPARLSQIVSYATRSARHGITIPQHYSIYVSAAAGDRYGIGARDGSPGRRAIVPRRHEWPDGPAHGNDRGAALSAAHMARLRNPLGARAMYLGGTVYAFTAQRAGDIGNRSSLHPSSPMGRLDSIQRQRRHQGDRAADGPRPTM